MLLESLLPVIFFIYAPHYAVLIFNYFSPRPHIHGRMAPIEAKFWIVPDVSWIGK